SNSFSIGSSLWGTRQVSHSAPLRHDGARRADTLHRARHRLSDARGLHGARRRTSTLARFTGPSFPCPTCAHASRPTRGAPRGPQASLDARALHRAQLHLSDARAACPTRWGLHGLHRRASTLARSTGPIFPCPTLARAACPTRWGLHGPQLPLSDARAACPTRWGLHGPSFPCPTRAHAACPTRGGSTGPAGQPRRSRAPRAQLHLSDARARCLSDARGSTGPTSEPRVTDRCAPCLYRQVAPRHDGDRRADTDVFQLVQGPR
ncbi:hypothetical protein SAMN05443639_113174, partial [Stigmatella erecta]